MSVTGISFFYEEEKSNILKERAKIDERTLSGYIQKVLQNHINSVNRGEVKAPKKKRIIKRRKKNG